MFEGGFTKSGPGEKQIQIKGTKIKTLELSLRFMSIGRLATYLIPKTMYTDKLDMEYVSLEDLFLAADRYDMKELRNQMLGPLLAGLDSTNAVPLLFRVAQKIVRSMQVHDPVCGHVAWIGDNFKRYPQHLQESPRHV